MKYKQKAISISIVTLTILGLLAALVLILYFQNNRQSYIGKWESKSMIVDSRTREVQPSTIVINNESMSMYSGKLLLGRGSVDTWMPMCKTIIKDLRNGCEYQIEMQLMHHGYARVVINKINEGISMEGHIIMYYNRTE